MELKGAVALVTGGNGGLGQRICPFQRGFHRRVVGEYSRVQCKPGRSKILSLDRIQCRGDPLVNFGGFIGREIVNQWNRHI